MASHHDVATLIANADHDSVNAQRLTETKPSLTTRYLHSQPLIDYLEPNEQPHFILAARNKTITTSGSDAPPAPPREGTGMTMHMVTNDRWLTVAANSGGDQWFSVSLSEINGVSVTKGGSRSHEVQFSTEDYKVTVPIGNMYDDDDIDAIHSWLVQHTSADGVGVKEPTPRMEEGRASAEEDEESLASPKHMDADPQGNWVTPKRVEKMGDILDHDENVHYMFKGRTIDVEGSTSGESIWGNDRDRKSSLMGIFTAATDKRVVIHIPQFLGDDERHVPYSSIVSCDLDTGLVNRRVSLQTKGPTYHIQAQGPDKDELRTALRFIRDKSEEADKVVVEGGGSGPDPTEQLKNIKELHDAGVLSDEEFEEKKQSLLDKI